MGGVVLGLDENSHPLMGPAPNSVIAHTAAVRKRRGREGPIARCRIRARVYAAMRKRGPTVVIVGGGTMGLASAWKLAEWGAVKDRGRTAGMDTADAHLAHRTGCPDDR